MRKTFLVMRHELMMTLRRKMFMFFALGLPLILLIVAGVIMLVNNNRDEEEVVAEETPAELPQGYVDFAGLLESEAPGIPAGSLVRYLDEASAQDALTAGQIDGYFLIPAEYLEGGEVTYMTNDYSPMGDNVNTQAIDWLLLTNLLGNPQQAGLVWQPVMMDLHELTRPGEDNVDQYNWIVELLPTLMMFIIYMTIIIPAGNLVNAITDEKKNRVMESILVSVSSRQFISGKILALGLLGLMQILAWMGLVYAVVRFGGQGLNIPQGFTVDTMLLVWVIVYSLLGYAMYGVLMAGLGALVPDIKDARGASFMLLIPLIVVYMFNMITVQRPNGLIALFFSFFPLTAPVGMIGRMAATDVPFWQGALSAAIQLGTAIGLLLLVARLFQARYILSGQPFNMKRYFAALAGRA